jgi:hypothetical protein
MTALGHREREPAPSLDSFPRRWQTWRHREVLDGLLIDGAEPGSHAELRLRARQLTAISHRYRLAAELSAIATSDVPRVACGRRLSGELITLAADLRGDFCEARGVAMVRRLLRDPSSPLGDGAAAEGELADAVREASRAL